MHEQMAVVAKIENNEFSAALNGGYRSAPDLLAKYLCRWLRDRAGPENPCRYDALAHKAGCVEIVYNSLYFREFGHFGSGSEVQGSTVLGVRLLDAGFRFKSVFCKLKDSTGYLPACGKQPEISNKARADELLNA